MAEIMDFIGFTYNGKHSYDDFGIYRTSDGSRYNDNLVPSMTDKTVDVPGGDGQYYFYTTHKNRQFNISIAFDNLPEVKYREMRQWLDGKAIHDLIFDEAPYKVYSAKVTGTPQLKTICFDEEGQRIYKGEGTIQFTCYYPYAHTPELLKLKSNIGYEIGVVTKEFNQQGGIFYSFKSEEPIILDKPYTIRIDIKKIQPLGDSDNTFRLNIGLSQTPGGRYLYDTFKDINFTNGIPERVSYIIHFTEDNYKTIKDFDETKPYYIGISSYEPDNKEWKYQLTFDYYLCKEFIPESESNKCMVYNGKLPFGWQALYDNANDWLEASKLSLNSNGLCGRGENYGDIPAPFVVKQKIAVANSTFKVGDNEITILEDGDITWDSRTGLITKEVDGKQVPIPYTGKSYGTLPVGDNTGALTLPTGSTIEYNYWYY